MKKLVFCASIGNSGNYLPKDPIVKNPDWDHICFTSCNNIKSNTWKIIKLPKPKGMSYAKFARYVKIMVADKYWDHYDISLWLDTKFTITQNLNSFANKYLLSRDCDFMIMDHHKRNCIYDEIITLKEKNFRGNTKVIRSLEKQIKEYKSENMPENFGLYQDAIFIRKHQPNVHQFMKLWYNEVLKHSRRDMVSFPYILWKNPNLCKIYVVNFRKTYEMFMNRS